MKQAGTKGIKKLSQESIDKVHGGAFCYRTQLVNGVTKRVAYACRRGQGKGGSRG